MINLLNDRRLAKTLKTGEVSVKEHFYYLLILFLLGQFFATSFITSITYSPITWWSIATDIVYLVSVLLGIILIYNTNKQGDNKKFIERFICLSIPITIQLTLVFLLIYLTYRFFPLEKISPIFHHHQVFSFMLGVFYNAYFYLRLNSSMKIASH